LVQESNTTVTVSNTATETDLFSVSLAAAADTVQYRITAAGTYTNNSGGSVQPRWNLKIGSTNMLINPGRNVATQTDARPWTYEAVVQMVGSKSAQRGSSLITVAGAATPVLLIPVYSAATEDLSSALTWALRITLGSATNTECNLNFFSITEIRE
jgi:hypothetical protein